MNGFECTFARPGVAGAVRVWGDAHSYVYIRSYIKNQTVETMPDRKG